jgi:hypothetical protein
MGLNKIRILKFEVFMEVIMKNVVFWDVMPCSLVDINGSTFYLIQGKE